MDFIDPVKTNNVNRYGTNAAIALAMSGSRMVCVETGQGLELIDGKLYLTEPALRTPFTITEVNYKYMWTIDLQWKRFKLEQFARGNQP